MKNILLIVFMFISVLSFGQGIQERNIKATEVLETGITFIYQGVDIPVLDISYHEWSTDSITWGKEYTTGDCYLRISNDVKTSWVGFNVCENGGGTSQIDTVIICSEGVCDTITNGTVTINIPEPITITGTTANTSTDTTHTHELILNMGEVENVDTTLVVDGYILKWNSVTETWFGAPDLTGGGAELTVTDGDLEVNNVIEIIVENGRLINRGAGTVEIDFLLEPIDGANEFYRTDTVDVTAGDMFLTFSSPLPANDYVVASVYTLYPSGERQNLTYDSTAVDGFRVIDILGESELHYLVIRNLDSLALAIGQINDKMEWKNVWSDVTYYKNDVVYDEGYSMVANTETTDRAAPQPVGEESYLYTSTLTDTTKVADQVVFGTRYISDNSYFINGYRVYVVGGNYYEIITVRDPDGANEVQFVNSFTADVTGWREFGLVPRLVTGGVDFQLLAIVSEPNPIPVLDTFNYNYQKPTNATAPISGQITQASKQLDILSIHETDNDASDRSVFLSSLGVGDFITINDTRFSIQGTSDQGVYWNVAVAPAKQASGVGVTGVIFETTPASTITYGYDKDYWAGSDNIQGLFVADGSWTDVVADSTQYGTDLKVQESLWSTDWDLLSSTTEGGASGGIQMPLDTLVVTHWASIGDSLSVGESTRSFNSSVGVPQFTTDVPGVVNQLGLEDWTRVINNTGVQIPNGKVVSFSGFQGDSLREVILATNTDPINAQRTLGVLTSTLEDGEVGFATRRGDVNDMNTNHLSQQLAGYLGTNGEITNTIPAYPNTVLVVGATVKQGVSDGIFGVFLSNAAERIPIGKGYGFTSNGIPAGTYYRAGFYDAPSGSSSFSTLASTVTYGTADVSYDAHPFIVCGNTTSVDDGVVALIVTGQVVYDDGTTLPNHVDTIMSDITDASLNAYFEAEKYRGTFTMSLVIVSGAPTILTTPLNVNYGYAKYDDLGNNDFYLTNMECIWEGGASDATGFNIELLHHKSTGWVYSAGAFVAGDGAIAERAVDQAGFLRVTSGVSSPWKRSGLDTFINGSGSEGFLFRITTGANGTIQSMDMHVGVFLE